MKWKRILNDFGRDVPPGAEHMKAIKYSEHVSLNKLEELEKPVPKADGDPTREVNR
jgi:hypothetical protein